MVNLAFLMGYSVIVKLTIMAMQWKACTVYWPELGVHEVDIG